MVQVKEEGIGVVVFILISFGVILALITLILLVVACREYRLSS